MAQSQRSVSRDDDEKLDFNEAMRDFCTMFPTLDETIIESVLRANNGAVDDTIDQLLLMTTDLDGYKETLPKRVDQPSSSSVNIPPGLFVSSSVGSTAEDLLADFLNLPASPRPPTNTTPQVSPRSVTLPVQKKTYHPPLVGKLPSDFLRIGAVQQAVVPAKKHSYSDPPPPYAATVRRAYSVSSQQQRSPQVVHRAHLGIFSTSVPSTSGGGGGGGGGSTRRRHKNMDAQLQRQAEILKDKMAENQWRRQLTHDPELEQFLEDERIALMLQNQEFLWQLQNDRDFLAALERDAAMQKYKTKAEKKGSKHVKGNPNDLINARFAVIDSPSREETVMEGYSDLPVDPFPYTKSLPKNDDAEMAFSDKLKLMGKSSKRKFALMARRFVRKKKGAKGILGTSDSHYSGMSLLEATDESEDRHSLLQPDSGYNQSADEAYNISDRTDLKEGRLFSS